MESEKNPEIVQIHNLGPVTRFEFEELKKDLLTYERRWIDQNKRIHKLGEKYHAIRRWQSWVLGASAVGFYVVGFLSKWILDRIGIKTQ